MANKTVKLMCFAVVTPVFPFSDVPNAGFEFGSGQNTGQYPIIIIIIKFFNKS